jgi:hypothetical protein
MITKDDNSGFHLQVSCCVQLLDDLADIVVRLAATTPKHICQAKI